MKDNRTQRSFNRTPSKGMSWKWLGDKERPVWEDHKASFKTQNLDLTQQELIFPHLVSIIHVTTACFRDVLWKTTIVFSLYLNNLYILVRVVSQKRIQYNRAWLCVIPKNKTHTSMTDVLFRIHKSQLWPQGRWAHTTGVVQGAWWL